ncbi:MAG: transcriptional repressor [Lactobacillus sp.]|jgi:Fur family zinc uptake transcriptional regulator|uniref:Fur family transcriptional regulator n=1 Tax=Lacticaseibacillus suilingensis TaxID=2799577 RepID=A0ABW4BDM0_9LACO|nr:Fur family transcriptional regulator [Lacticaseibacillus suilingensis]MCI1893232.1 transcriptional repressor [Lactobacillus sp.]MCI1917392.1 transcriptional repressor [Lactobacillus sp.]MCI1940818.1 transcriptional repressor [Lactobacillus sp.]MCI1971197.1 transcriptional repressor [Lactobacillus sp.]MCI2016430.1 transcriptional repressor [Lactobacillus sp.]
MSQTTIAIDKMKQSGMRVTKQRRDLVAYLAASEQFVPVTTLDKYMRQQYPGLSHDTIYRNVKEFEKLGILESDVQNEQAIVKLQCDFQHPHHHHFICTNCHRVQELKMCPLDYFENQLPGAKIASHNFELYGLCADCAQKQVANN